MAIDSVLLVDDEPDLRKVAELSLRGVGRFRVALAASGEEALALAAREAPDVVLLDVMMPGLDGDATLQALRALPGMAEVPVLFMTAGSQLSDAAALARKGVAGVIRKPFDPMRLPEQVRALVAAHHARAASGGGAV